MPNKGTGTWSSTEAEIPPVCPICQGAGFIHPTLPSGKPDFSRVVICKCILDEKDDERRERLERYSHLGALKRFTFDKLLSQGRSGSPLDQQQFQSAYNAAKVFAKEPAGWLVFSGPSGCGKTHLAAAIANERIRQGQPALYRTTADLLDDLRAGFNPGEEAPYNQTFEAIRNTPLLVLDDFGSHSSTAWAQEKLDQLIDYRHSQQLPTVITTETAVEHLDERIQSRLADDSLCHAFKLGDWKSSSPEYSWGEGLNLQKQMAFDNFDYRRVNLPNELQEHLENVYHRALKFAKSPEGWLVFQGVTGCGKTHLAAAIVNHRYQEGKPARFVVVPDFLDHLRSTFNPDSKVSYDKLFESVKKTPLLVLDDFGEQAATPWAKEKLYQVISARYNAMLPTVITTRCSLDEIDSPIASRFIDPKLSVMFEIQVPDFRGDHKPKSKTSTYHHTRKQTR